MYENKKFALNKVLIMDYEDSEKLLNKNNDILEGIKYKISNELTFCQGVKSVAFQYNSPIRKMFAEHHLKVLEFGLDIKWKSDYDHINKIEKRAQSYEFNEDEDEENTLPIILSVVMLVGIIISLLVFFLELVWFYCLSKINWPSVFKRFVKSRKQIKFRKIKVQPCKTTIINI